MLDKVLKWMTAELKQEIRASKVNEIREGRVFEESIEGITAELKQEIRASKVNQTGERRVFDEAIKRMTAELKQETRATKVNQTVEGKVKSIFRERRVKIVPKLSNANEPTRRYPALFRTSTVLEKK